MDKLQSGKGRARHWPMRTINRCLIVAVLALFGIPLETAHAGTSSGLLYTYPIIGNPFNVAVAGPGDVWYTLPDDDTIGRLKFTSTGDFWTEYHPLANIGSQPYDIAYGNGSIWFTERGTNRIGKIDVATGERWAYEIPIADSEPTGIDLDASGIVWFVTFSSSHLGRFDPNTETFDMFAYERDGAQLEDVSATANGSLWLTAPGVNRAIEFDKGSRRFKEVNQPSPGSLPHNIAVSDVGIPWITDQGRGELAFFLEGTGEFWLFLKYTDGGGHPVGIAHSTTDGLERVWFTDDQNGLVGQFMIRGNTGSMLPSVRVNNPAGIAVDEQDNAWIAVAGGIAVWRPPYWSSIYLPVIHR